MAELTEREKEFELFGMGIDDLEQLVRTRAAQQNIPVTHILIDWLELAQYQLEDRYRNVHHIINRLIYVLQSGMVIDNPAEAGKSETPDAVEKKPSKKKKD
ncbi:MAG TPA: hypothetical protein VFJ67_03900 [Thermodesulfobacteriota bacterium]|nr:hypothetical protein [Thermodesulfobacteriota bacterium]